jgi:GNAT superfamily N-acetyltransferase
MAAKNEPSEWLVESLKNHDRKAFSCGNEVLDCYLKEIASQDAKRKVAAPFVLVAKTAPKTIVGYYTLSASGIDLSGLPEETVKKLARYPVVPVTLLGRLAVDTRFRGQGLGEHLLIDALKRAFTRSSEIAATAVVVDAIDAAAVDFYKHFEFLPFPEKPDRLFLPMQSIAKLF